MQVLKALETLSKKHFRAETEATSPKCFCLRAFEQHSQAVGAVSEFIIVGLEGSEPQPSSSQALLSWGRRQPRASQRGLCLPHTRMGRWGKIRCYTCISHQLDSLALPITASLLAFLSHFSPYTLHLQKENTFFVTYRIAN